jgi:MFS family permease
MATTTTTAPARLPFGLRLPDSVSVLAERDFRVIWTGQAISMTGTWMQMIAQGLLVLELWDSAFALGAINFANAIPTLVVMLFGGVLADQGDKRRILIATQVVMCAVALAVAFLVAFDAVQFWMLIVASVAVGIAFGYDMPAYQALLPELVPPERISQVVGLNSSTFHGTRMVGPAFAGLIISAFGIATAYFLNALSFVAVIFSLLIIRYRPQPRADDAPQLSAIEGLREGIAHTRERPHVRVILSMVALACIFLFPFMAILSPFYVKEVLDAGPGVLGALWAMSGIGSLLGALALVWWPTQHRTLRIWIGAALGPVGLVTMALTRDPVVAVVASGISSISFSSQLGLFQAMLQESTPQNFRGRVMSLNGIAFNGTIPLAGIAAAGLAAIPSVGLPAVMLGASAAYAVLAVVMLRFAGGGMERIVAKTHEEYAAIAGMNLAAARVR